MSYFPIRPVAQNVYFSSNKEMVDSRRSLLLPLNNQQAKPPYQTPKFGIDHYSWHPNSPNAVNVSPGNSSNQLKLGENSSFQDHRLPSFNEIQSESMVQTYANNVSAVEQRFTTSSFSPVTSTPPSYVSLERLSPCFERPLNCMDTDIKDWDQSAYNLESSKVQYPGNFNHSVEATPISTVTNFNIPYSCDFDEPVAVNSSYQEPSIFRNPNSTTQTLDQAMVVNYNESFESSDARSYNPRIISATEKIRPITFKNSDCSNLTSSHNFSNSATVNQRNPDVKQNSYCEYSLNEGAENLLSLRKQHYSDASKKYSLLTDCYALPRENLESFNFPTDLSGNASKKFRSETDKVASFYTSNSKVTCTRNTKIKMKISDEIIFDRNEVQSCRNMFPPKAQDLIDTSTNRIREADSSSVFQNLKENGHSGELFNSVNENKLSKTNPTISPISSPECSAMNLIKYDSFEFMDDNVKEPSRSSPVITFQPSDIVEEEPTDLSGFQSENTKKANHVVTLKPEINFSLQTDIIKSSPASQSSNKPVFNILHYKMNNENSEFYTVENMKLFTSSIMQQSKIRNKITVTRIGTVLSDSDSAKEIEGCEKEAILKSPEKPFGGPQQEPAQVQTIQSPISFEPRGETALQQSNVYGKEKTSSEKDISQSPKDTSATAGSAILLEADTVEKFDTSEKHDSFVSDLSEGVTDNDATFKSDLSEGVTNNDATFKSDLCEGTTKHAATFNSNICESAIKNENDLCEGATKSTAIFESDLRENAPENTTSFENVSKLSQNISKDSNDLSTSNQFQIETLLNEKNAIRIEEENMSTLEEPSVNAMPVLEISNKPSQIISVNSEVRQIEENSPLLPDCEPCNIVPMSTESTADVPATNSINNSTNNVCETFTASPTSTDLTDYVQTTNSADDLMTNNTETCGVTKSSDNNQSFEDKDTADVSKNPRTQSKKVKPKKPLPKQRKPTYRSVTTQTLISIINETNLMSPCNFEIIPRTKKEATPTATNAPKSKEKTKTPCVLKPQAKKEAISKTPCTPDDCIESTLPSDSAEQDEIQILKELPPKPEIFPPKKPSTRKRKDKPVTRGTRRSERQSKQQQERLNNALLFDQRQCRICKEYLIYERSVSDQFTIHVDKSKEVCSACNICFLQKPILHANTEKKPFVCSICEQRFTRKLNLDMHMVKHTGEKPFVCSICFKAYGHKFLLTRHSNSVHRM